MTALMTELDDRMERERRAFVVVHPLDDVPEEKVETEHLGPMQMTRTVKICLFAMRGYLLLMVGLLAFRVMQLGGAPYMASGFDQQGKEVSKMRMKTIQAVRAAACWILRILEVRLPHGRIVWAPPR